MTTLAQIRDWLKTQVDCPHWYIGKIDGSKDTCIGIYGRPTPDRVKPTIGGMENRSYALKAVSILVHWGKNANLAEQKAQEVYVALIGRSNFKVGNTRIVMVDMRNCEPVAIGTDENGVYEYVIDAYFFYERGES